MNPGVPVQPAIPSIPMLPSTPGGIPHPGNQMGSGPMVNNLNINLGSLLANPPNGQGHGNPLLPGEQTNPTNSVLPDETLKPLEPGVKLVPVYMQVSK